MTLRPDCLRRGTQRACCMTAWGPWFAREPLQPHAGGSSVQVPGSAWGLGPSWRLPPRPPAWVSLTLTPHEHLTSSFRVHAPHGSQTHPPRPPCLQAQSVQSLTARPPCGTRSRHLQPHTCSLTPAARSTCLLGCQLVAPSKPAACTVFQEHRRSPSP